jgi:AraC-like DNA-binding protein
MPATVLTSWALLIWKTLQANGHDAQRVFKSAGLNSECLGDGNARYSVSAMQQLWAAAADEANDLSFASEVGKSWGPTTFHALGYAWLASSTLFDALERFARYSRIITTGADIDFKQTGAIGQLSLSNTCSDLDVHPAAWNASVTSLVKMCRMIMGENYSPLEIRCQFPRAADSSILEAYVRCPVHYKSSATSFLFDDADLHRSLPAGNSELQRVNEELLLSTLSQLDKSCAVTQVIYVIKARLPSGGVNEKQIAEALNISVRTLQRKLSDEGSSFNALYLTVRKELAEQYLRNSNISLNETAYLLGFSNQANFTRAFKRWHGVPPSAYRSEQLKQIA